MRIFIVTTLLLASCSSPTTDDDLPDMSVSDAAVSDVAVPDASDPTDAADAATAEPDVAERPDIAVVVDASTSDFTAAVDSGGVQAEFDYARYGLTDPTMSASGEWELYVEMYRGGDGACPTETSGTPDQTVIIAGLPVSDAPYTATEADGLSVVMLDFEGLVTTEPILRATGEEASIEGLNVCTDCPGEDDADGFVAFELSAPLDDGAIAGRVRATHCASLDTSP